MHKKQGTTECPLKAMTKPSGGGGNSLIILPASLCWSPPSKAAQALTSVATAGVTGTVETALTMEALGVTVATGTAVTGLLMATTGVAGVTAATPTVVAEAAGAGAGGGG